MLRVTLADETWDFDETSMLNVEAIKLQKITGMKWQELLAGLFTADPAAITGLVWLCRRRAGVADAQNRHHELEFDLRDFDWEPVDEDGRVLRYRDGVIVSRDGVPEPGYDAEGNPLEAGPDDAGAAVARGRPGPTQPATPPPAAGGTT